jgi:hypothetical protein
VTDDAIITFLGYRKHCKHDIPFARRETVIGFHIRLDRFTARMAVSTLCQDRDEFGSAVRRLSSGAHPVRCVSPGSAEGSAAPPPYGLP